MSAECASAAARKARVLWRSARKRGDAAMVMMVMSALSAKSSVAKEVRGGSRYAR